MTKAGFAMTIQTLLARSPFFFMNVRRLRKYKRMMQKEWGNIWMKLLQSFWHFHFRRRSSIISKAMVKRCMSKVAKGNECYDYEESEVQSQSLKNKVQGEKKEYNEQQQEEECWIPHRRTGIYYPKGHEWVMEDVPDGAACFAYSYWLRNSDRDGV